MGRPRIHDEHTRVELLAAAERLIAERGLDSLSVRATADAAGTSTRAVYALFQSKEGLLQALAQRTFELLMEAVAAVPRTGAAADDLVRVAVHGFRRFALEHPELFHLFFSTQMQRPRLTAETDATRVAALNQLITLVERAKAAGALGAHSVQQVTLLWDVMCVGLAMREFCWLIPREQSEQVWTDALTALLAGLGTTPATAVEHVAATPKRAAGHRRRTAPATAS
jgi:AcrR family transcriptional regulator